MSKVLCIVLPELDVPQMSDERWRELSEQKEAPATR